MQTATSVCRMGITLRIMVENQDSGIAACISTEILRLGARRSIISVFGRLRLQLIRCYMRVK